MADQAREARQAAEDLVTEAEAALKAAAVQEAASQKEVKAQEAQIENTIGQQMEQEILTQTFNEALAAIRALDAWDYDVKMPEETAAVVPEVAEAAASMDVDMHAVPES